MLQLLMVGTSKRSKATWYGGIHNCESMNPWKFCWLNCQGASCPCGGARGRCLRVNRKPWESIMSMWSVGLQRCLWHYECLDSHLKWQACSLIGPFGMVDKSWLLSPLNSPIFPCCRRLTNHQCLVACLVIWGSASIQDTAGLYHKQWWHHYHTSSVGLSAEVHIIPTQQVQIGSKLMSKQRNCNSTH